MSIACYFNCKHKHSQRLRLNLFGIKSETIENDTHRASGLCFVPLVRQLQEKKTTTWTHKNE